MFFSTIDCVQLPLQWILKGCRKYGKVRWECLSWLKRTKKRRSDIITIWGPEEHHSRCFKDFPPNNQLYRMLLVAFFFSLPVGLCLCLFVCVCVRSLSRFNPRKKSDISTDMSYLLCVASTYMLHLIILCMSSWNSKWLQHGVVVTWWPRYWPVYRDAWQHCLNVLSCSQGFWSMSLELSSRDTEFHSTGVLSSKSACVHSNLCLDSEVNTKLSLKIFS